MFFLSHVKTAVSVFDSYDWFSLFGLQLSSLQANTNLNGLLLLSEEARNQNMELLSNQLLDQRCRE